MINGMKSDRGFSAKNSDNVDMRRKNSSHYIEKSDYIKMNDSKSGISFSKKEKGPKYSSSFRSEAKKIRQIK